MANVFNTFSFNKWADTKKEEEIDKESRKRRHEQIKRLKEKLRKERELRESGSGGGDGDVDLEALIEALQSGEAINAESNPFDNWHNGRYVPGTMRVANQPGRVPSARRTPTAHSVPDPEYDDGKGAIDLPDDYILEEIRRYRSAHPESRMPSAAVSTAIPERGGSRISSAGRPASEDDRLRWQYNRRMGSLRDDHPHSLPPSRTPSVSRVPSARKTSARPARTTSADRFNYNRYVTDGQRY